MERMKYRRIRWIALLLLAAVLLAAAAFELSIARDCFDQVSTMPRDDSTPCPYTASASRAAAIVASTSASV
jgi:hypothetical protein